MAAVVVAFLVLSLIASTLVLAAVVAAGMADEAGEQQREPSAASPSTADTPATEDHELERLSQ